MIWWFKKTWISCRKDLKVLMLMFACNIKSQELDWVKNELELTHSFPLQAVIYLLTWPSFCISDQRSSTSVPHWAATCTHAWAYCPATEFSRLREHPERDQENHPDAWKPGTWVGNNWSGIDLNRCYLSGCTLFPRQTHEQAEGWWRSPCQLAPLPRPEIWWSPSGSLSTPAPGRVVGGFYLCNSNRKVVYDLMPKLCILLWNHLCV